MRPLIRRTQAEWLALIASLLSLALAPTARAASLTWNGNTSTAWNTGSNWSGGSQPGNGDDVTIPAGLARYPIVSAANANAKSVILSAGAGAQPTLTVSAQALSVGSTFTVNAGSVSLSGGTLSTGGAVLISGAASLTGGTWLCSFGMTVASGGSLSVSGTGLLHMGNNAGNNPTDNLTINANATLTQSGGNGRRP
jgi:fibronectin-binding autotransporter adhesin